MLGKQSVPLNLRPDKPDAPMIVDGPDHGRVFNAADDQHDAFAHQTEHFG
jgi:hypothetical protein